MKIFGHRGFPGPDRPENTVEAVEAAFAAGADGVEIDVRRTADGVLVCAHDPTLGRLTGHPVDVATTTFDELAGLPLAGQARLAVLSDVLDVIARHGGAVIAEVKRASTTRTAVDVALAVAAVLAARAAAGRADEVTLSSFDPWAITAVRRAHPALPTGLLTAPTVPAADAVHRAVAVGAAQVHPHVGPLVADPVAVRQAQAAGLGVVCWTVNSYDDVRTVDLAGVDTIITDDPAFARPVVSAPVASEVAV